MIQPLFASLSLVVSVLLGSASQQELGPELPESVAESAVKIEAPFATSLRAGSRSAPLIVLVQQRTDEGWVTFSRGVMWEALRSPAAPAPGSDARVALELERPPAGEWRVVAWRRLAPGSTASKASCAGSFAATMQAGDAVERVSIELAGEGHISGQLLDGSGGPCVGAHLALVAIELDGEREPSFELRLQLESRGEGLGYVVATTDADGRFEAMGLRPGDFSVAMVDAPSPKGPDWNRSTSATLSLQDRPQPGIVAADGSSHILEVDRGSLTVAVRGHEGAVVPTIAHPLLRPRWEWPSMPVIGLRSSMTGKWVTPRMHQAVQEEVHFANLVPGTYFIDVITPSHGYVQRTVEVPAAGVRETIALQAEKPFGTVRFAAVAGPGQEPGWAQLDEVPLTVRIADATGKAELLSDTLALGSGKHRDLELPTGRYVAEFWETWILGISREGLVSSSDFAFQRVAFQVIAGEQIDIPVQALLGGRFEVEFVASPDASELDRTSRAEFPVGAEQALQRMVAMLQPAGQIVVRDASGLEPSSLVFEWTGLVLKPSVRTEPGNTSMRISSGPSSPLVPGAYTMDLTLPGGRLVTRTFEIEAGETTELRVELR